MQVGLTLSVMRQTLLHFNKVPLPISALLCKKPEATIFYLYKSNETQRDQMWPKAPSSTWHTLNTHTAPLKSSLHPTHPMPRQLPGHCPALPAAGQGSLEQETAHTHVPISPADFKMGNQGTAVIKISSVVPPSEVFNFFHKTSQTWGRKTGGFLHTQVLMLQGPVTLPSHCSPSKAGAPWRVCTSNPANPEWAPSVLINGAAGISSLLYTSSDTGELPSLVSLKCASNSPHSRMSHTLGLISTLCTKGQLHQWSHVWGIMKHNTGTRSEFWN